MSLRISLLCALTLSLHAGAATYYVDSNAGDDHNLGTDQAAPWKSLQKVTNATLQPGDKVLFNRGSVWSGQLAIPQAGTADSPLYFGAYGDETKPKPTINGGGNQADGKVNEAAIYLKNTANSVTVENFAVTNFDGSDIFDGAEDNRCGIKVGFWGGKFGRIKILHNDVSFVEGCSNHPKVGSPRGSKLDKNKFHQYMCGAIFANGSEMKDVLIDGNDVHDCTGTGILAFAFKMTDGLLIQNNHINNVGSDGIEILNAAKPLVQYNSCIRCGNNSGARDRQPGELGCHGLAVCGMWATGSSDILFQYNYCEGTKQVKYDGQPWDFDNRLSGTCIYQYNLSRDNEGGFMLSNGDKKEGYTKIARFNISINDGGKQGAGEGFFNNKVDHYSNNIFYRTDGKGFMPPDKTLSSPQSGSFENNIFYTTATTDIAYQTKTRIFKNNCFFGHVPVDPGSDAVLADPLFVDTAGALTAHALDAVRGLQLQDGSPCLGKGVVVPDDGGKDFWGNALPADKRDIGAQAHP